jgi:hypothetical protein
MRHRRHGHPTRNHEPRASPPTTGEGIRYSPEPVVGGWERTHSGVAPLRRSSEARWEEHLGTHPAQQARPDGRPNVHALTMQVSVDPRSRKWIIDYIYKIYYGSLKPIFLTPYTY